METFRLYGKLKLFDMKSALEKQILNASDSNSGADGDNGNHFAPSRIDNGTEQY